MSMASMSSMDSMGDMEEHDYHWAQSIWPNCRNLTIHGPNTPQKPPSDIRKAAMTGKDSWYDMEKYSYAVTWLSLAIIGACIIPGCIHRLRRAYPQKSRSILSGTVVGRTYIIILAAARWIGYRQFNLRLPYTKTRHVTWRLPQSNHFIIISGISIGLTIWCFVIQPYYRCSREWGSPPLAIRAGMLANGLVPFLFALGTKVNVISSLTNISHERLQVHHQWLARLFLFFSVVHTLPFIIQPLKDGGKHNLYLWWYQNGPDMWTGTVALAILAWMVASSFGAVRSYLRYEFFVAQHVLSIILFLIFYFMHTGNTLNSWLWLWAAVGLWGLAVLIRMLRGAMGSRFFVNGQAVVEVQCENELATKTGTMRIRPDADPLIRIAIRTPLRWSPGQHVFVHFPSLGFLQPHPFTVITLPDEQRPHEDSLAVFVARVRGGLTRTLYKAARQAASWESELRSGHILTDQEKPSDQVFHSKSYSSQPEVSAITLPASVDGPYGSNSSLASYDAVVLVAGGSGFTYTISVLQDLALRANASTSGRNLRRQCTSSVRVIWSMRTFATLAWFQPQLEAVIEALSLAGIALQISIFVTRDNDVQEIPSIHLCQVSKGRPDVPFLCQQVMDEERQSPSVRSVAYAVCTPLEMADDVRGVVVSAQRRILRGNAGNIREVYMCKEHFGW